VSGRHFLQIPGPTNLPDRVLRAIDRPTIDHRGPDFQQLAFDVLRGMQRIVQTRDPVIIYPASGTGAWEAALVNTLSPGERVLMFETGHFAVLWRDIALKLGLDVTFVPGDWRTGAREVPSGKFAAVCVVHNETSTGVTSDVAALRKAIGSEPLLIVDTISSLASIDYRHDEWDVDVTVAGSQKGLMLPPGLSFNAVSARALARRGTLAKSYWDWQPMLQANANGYFPFTPATNLLYGLREAITMLEDEGLQNVFARHARHAAATRAAVKAWGLELNPLNPEEHSNSLTAIRYENSDRLRENILEKFDMSLGQGLGKLKDKLFRIGHLGWFNDLMLCGTLAGVEMGLGRRGGVEAAMELLK
jgi:alanine-glyoxylate transaminase/serine-glyoxylate transaminase/serine-pyruvate transaminase